MPRHRLLLPLLLLFAAAPALAWTTVGDGIEYQSFTTSHPNNLFVARMARSNLNAIIDASIAQFRAAGARETVRNQAARYDDELNWWGQSYGQRNKVVVAINGDFFNLTTGLMTGGSIQGGWYVKRFMDWGGTSGFSWSINRDLFIGDCVRHISDRQYVTFHRNGSRIEFSAINAAPPSNAMTIFTPQYDSDTNTGTTVTEVLVELTRPMMVVPGPGQVAGTIRQIRQNLGSTPIPFGHVVLSATGTVATSLAAVARVGDLIGISQEITSYTKDCSAYRTLDWSKTYASVGGNFTFLRDGVLQSTTNAGLTNRAPRTAVAYNNTYVFFIVCDGRDPGTSVGMSMAELGAFCRDTLGVTWGVNMDGGGSSTMVVNGAVMNNPSDGVERTVSNGVQMINLLPKQQSGVFNAGQPVSTNSAANMRLGPSTNYGVITTLPAAAEGSVLTDALNGIRAKGYNWWKVRFGTSDGWMAETLLDGQRKPGMVVVTDEGRWTPAATALSASWTQAADNSGSGINRYEYAIGTTPTTQNIRDWTSAGLATQVRATGVFITTGNTYYVRVRAVDNLGLTGEPGVSDGIAVPPSVSRIGQAWSLPDGAGLTLAGKSVTRASTGAFWLEEIDRSAAIKIVNASPADAGAQFSVAGVLGTHGAGRALLADVVERAGAAPAVQPVGMLLRELGGGSVNALTPGVTGGVGLYNIGMLARCRGVVTFADASDPANCSFYLDDGSGVSDGGPHGGVRVRCGSIVPPQGGPVSVTGIITSEAAPAGVAPVLLVTDAADIQAF